MKKIIGFVICLLLLSVQTMAASPAGEQYIKRIAVGNNYSLRDVSKNIYHSEFKEQEVLDVLAEKLIQSYNDGGKTNFDSIAWICKALGKSGNIRYKKILQTVKENTNNKKIKKFAKKSLKMMPKGEANESYQKGTVDLVSIRDNILNNLSVNNNHPPEIAKLEKKIALNLIIYGPEHRYVAINWNNLGAAWHRLAKYNKSIKYLEKSLASNLKTYGPGHSSVAINWSYLGMAWYKLGKYDKSKKYTEKALAAHLKIYGPDHIYVRRNWDNLGLAWSSLGKYEKAIEYFEKALAADLKAYGSEHPNVAIYWSNLGNAWQSLGKDEKAIEYYEKALASNLKTYGPGHSHVVNNWGYLSLAWASLGKYEKAIEYNEKALAYFKKNLGANHQKTKTTRSILRALQEKSREVY